MNNSMLRLVGFVISVLLLAGCATPPLRVYPLAPPRNESEAKEYPFVEYLFRPRQYNGSVVTAVDGKPVQYERKLALSTRIMEPRLAFQAVVPPGRHLISFRRQYCEVQSPGPGFQWVGTAPRYDLSSPEQTVAVEMRPGRFYRLTEEIEKGHLNVGWVKNSRTNQYIITISEHDLGSGARLSTVANVSLTLTSGIDMTKPFHKWSAAPAE